MRTIITAVAIALLTSPAFAQTRVAPGSVLFVDAADPGLTTAIAAAIQKKKVPVTLTTREEHADYVLRVVTDAQKEGTGERIAKVALLGAFAGSGKSRQTAMTLEDRTGAIVFSYQTTKVKLQSASEGIAKHLGDHMKGKT
jgi:hypothetical protein